MVGPGARCALDGRQDLRFRIGCVDPSDAKARGPVVTVCPSTDFPVFTRRPSRPYHHPGRATAGLRLCSAPVNYAVLLFPDFSLIVLGYVLCRFTQLNRTVWRQQQELDEFPSLRRWFDAIRNRPATIRAYARGEPFASRPAVTEEGKKLLFGQTAAGPQAR